MNKIERPLTREEITAKARVWVAGLHNKKKTREQSTAELKTFAGKINSFKRPKLTRRL